METLRRIDESTVGWVPPQITEIKEMEMGGFCRNGYPVLAGMFYLD